MKTFKDYINESEISIIKDKYLKFVNGTVSIDSDTAIIVSNNTVDNAKIYI